MSIDPKNCIDFVCEALATKDACIYRDKIFDPHILFSCKDCDIKSCQNCIKNSICENKKG